MTPMFLYGPSTVGVGALTVKEITGLTMVQGLPGSPRLSKAIPLSSSWSSCRPHTLVACPYQLNATNPVSTRFEHRSTLHVFLCIVPGRTISEPINRCQ